MIDTMIFPTNLSPDNLIINSNFTYVFSTNKSIPYQGWKIHISATLDNYQIILDSVTTICLTNDTPFKFINSIEKLFFIYSKKTSQTEIGKFITIYPENDQTFLYLLDVLYQELKYESGIQIMTDQNYKQSQVIFYRYGLMNASVKNGQRPCLFDNNGVAYPDLPGAYYSCPEFVTEYFPEKTNTSTILNERYDMKSILYQTGAGNIYIAIDITNSQKVIIKEARKYVYATRDITSIELLKNEAKIIKKLSGSVTPNYIDDFYLEGNYYLVEEFIEGKTLNALKTDFNLLLKRTPSEITTFNNKLQKIISKLFKSLEYIHNHGVIVDDISCSNIILTSENKVYFIDFETAYLKNEKPLIATTNSCYPKTIYEKFEHKDIVKLWYCIINLLTNASSLLKFDQTGTATLKLFTKMCLEMNFPSQLLNKFMKDFKLERNNRMFFINFIKLGMDLEKLIYKRDQLLDTLVTSSTIFIEGKSWCEKVDNYLAINQLGLTPSDKLTVKDIQGSDLDSQLARILLDESQENLSDDMLSENFFNDLEYKEKYRLLTILNSKLKNPNLFRKLVKSIISNNIRYEKNVPYLIIEDYLSPYLVDGNSGLIIELIKFSISEQTTEYDDFIKKLARGVEHPYAKSTSLYNGLAGLGLANAWLYRYFDKMYYLQTSIDIVNHICDYSIEKNGKFILIDPIRDEIKYSYSHGMLGQFYFFETLISLISKVQNKDKNYEKIHLTI